MSRHLVTAALLSEPDARARLAALWESTGARCTVTGSRPVAFAAWAHGLLILLNTPGKALMAARCALLSHAHGVSHNRPAGGVGRCTLHALCSRVGCRFRTCHHAGHRS